MKENEFDQHLKKAIIAEKRKESKEFLHSLENSLSASKVPRKEFNWRIAASIAVLIGFAGAFFLWNLAPSKDTIYSSYFQPYNNVVAPIVRDQANLSEKAKAFALYEQGSYRKAIDGFEVLSAKDSLSPATLNFYKANAYMQLQEFEKAKSLLQMVVDEHKEWKAESLWYLALISLKLEDIDTAKSYLNRLQQSNENAFKKKEVDDLLNTLD